MPEESFDRSLEQILAYPAESQSDSGIFVERVMKQVKREQRIRRLILFSFGLIGALFGLAGAMILSGQITWLFTEVLSGTMTMQLVLFLIAALAFYNWFMDDNLTLQN